MEHEKLVEPPELASHEMPAWVSTAEQRTRWRFSVGIARAVFEECGEGAVWAAARTIYSDDSLPTAPTAPGG